MSLERIAQLEAVKATAKSKIERLTGVMTDCDRKIAGVKEKMSAAQAAADAAKAAAAAKAPETPKA